MYWPKRLLNTLQSMGQPSTLKNDAAPSDQCQGHKPWLWPKSLADSQWPFAQLETMKLYQGKRGSHPACVL